jgi:arginine decarboxylase
MTGGTGQSDLGTPPLGSETFAYNSARMAAGIANFNILSHSSVLPKGLFNHVENDISQVERHFCHGAMLETVLAGHGADRSETAALATGLGVCWAEDQNGMFVGGFVSKFFQKYASQIDEDIAYAEAELWLTKSMNHELKIRGLRQLQEYDIYVNWLNIEKRFGYCLTAMGFLNFMYSDPIQPLDENILPMEPE